jgi:hypothetical protein
VPRVIVALDVARNATALIASLQSDAPPVHVDPTLRDRNKLVVDPTCLEPGEARVVADRIRAALK